MFSACPHIAVLLILIGLPARAAVVGPVPTPAQFDFCPVEGSHKEGAFLV